jgi:hypothetical protein
VWALGSRGPDKLVLEGAQMRLARHRDLGLVGVFVASMLVVATVFAVLTPVLGLPTWPISSLVVWQR